MSGRIIIIVVVLILTLAAALPPLSFTVRPSTALAPGSFELRIHLTPHPANRWLSWWCVGDDFDTSESELRIDGERGPTLFVRRLLDLPAGDYRCAATVDRITGERLTTTTMFSVH